MSRERLEFSRPPELSGAEAVIADHFSTKLGILHDSYFIVSALQGAGIWSYRGTTYTAVPGELDLMEPGEYHCINRFLTRSCTQRCIILPAGILREVAEELEANVSRLHVKRPHLRNPLAFQALASLHRSLESPATSLERDSRFWNSIRIYLENCLEDALPSRPAPKEDKAVRKAINLIESCYSQGIRLSELVQAAGVGKFRLIRAFNAHVGIPPHAYHLQVRVRRARELLHQGMAPAHVAAEVGFSDQSHFTRFFRRSLGTTPGEYRRATASGRAAGDPLGEGPSGVR